MPALATELLLLLVLILINGLLAMSELAVVSARKTKLQERAERGDAGASAALALASEPSRFLSTIQVGITLIGILAGALGGATLTRELERLLEQIPALAQFREPLSFAIVVLAIAYLSLIVGELAPKRIALNNAETIAALVAKPMRGLSIAAAPVVWVLTQSTEGILRLLRQPAPREEPVSDQEIKILIQQATEAGVLDPVEQDLVEGALSLADRRVNELMTPRPFIEWLDAADPWDESVQKVANSRHLYYPVGEDDLDNLLGILSLRQVWTKTLRGENIDLRSELLPPVLIAEHAPAVRLFRVFQETNGEIALVGDEHGGIVGLVTLADLLAAVTGDTLVLGRRSDLRSIQKEDGSWLLDGLLSLEDLKETLHLADLPGEDRGRYQSLGGFVFSQLGRMPAVGDAFEWSDWRFEVADMDGRRIDKVLVAHTG